MELLYVLLALVIMYFFYKRHLLYLLQDRKQTMQMLLIFVLVVCLVYVICDYVLDVVPNNIRNKNQVIPLPETKEVTVRT